MDQEKIRKLLEDVKSGNVSISYALGVLKSMPFEDLDFAKIDTHRDIRQGFPEVVFCLGKTEKQIVEIVEHLSQKSSLVIATRANESIYKAIRSVNKGAVYYKEAKIVLIGEKRKVKNRDKYILVVSAGTSDISVAEEAAVTSECMGNVVKRLYDVGVAGVHRLFYHRELIFGANVLVVVAGMDGALASVVGGLVSKPVIAVPTSVGYGANFGGISALLSMLNSCATGVAVVNIDNGFGAGYIASLINQIGE